MTSLKTYTYTTHETNGNFTQGTMEPTLKYFSFKSEGTCDGRTRIEKILVLLVIAFVLAVVALVIALVLNESTCSGRTRIEKILVLLVLVFVLAVVGLVIALVLVSRADQDAVDTEREMQGQMSGQSEICDTPDCVKAAARVMDSMDASVDPCEDFYTYACGAWKRKHVIPEDSNSQNVFRLLRDGVEVINKYLLEDEQSYRDVDAIQKAKDLYASCNNLEKIENLTHSIAIPLLEELGGWPVLGSNPGGNWDAATFDLVTLLGKLRKYNNRPLVQLYVSADSKASTENILFMDQPSFGLPGRDYYLDPRLQRMRDAYVTFANSVAEYFGADPATIETDIREVMRLETDLANISMKSEERRDSEALYNKMTVDQMAANLTEPTPTSPIQFRWLDYVQRVMGLDGVNIPINGSEPVVVCAVPYFRKLFTVLDNYTPRTVANYLVWSIMKNRAANLPQKFRDLIKDYNKVVYGTETTRARWRTCGNLATSEFGLAVGHMFVKETFDESAKSVALEMIENIQDAFNELLGELDWMDETTKTLARDKAAAIQKWIGYPDYILREEDINKLYENVTVVKDRYFDNMLNNLKWDAIDGLKDLREKYNKSVWTTAPSTVNAFYSSIRNNIMFPAGILQPPFYSRDQPKSMNYGGIGMVIGHEITHGFDDRGRQYDKYGNLVEWWDAQIVQNFKQKAQCIVDQYSGFVVPEANLSVNGINTQGENIADNGGLKQSFRAYRKWVETQGKEEPKLPGLNLTHNQLFFINFAQLWCNNVRPENVIINVNTGVHSPAQFRVIGTLQNSPDFARAFNCPATSYMNPERKCYVW